MGHLPDDYCIASDGTILRKNDVPKSKKIGVAIAIFVMCLFMTIIWVAVSKINHVTYDINELNYSFDYPTWRSYNHSHNSLSFKEYTLAVDNDDVLSLEYYVESEHNCDVLTITLIDVAGNKDTLCMASGKQSQEIYRTINGKGGVYRLIAVYKKDRSVSEHGDYAEIKRLNVWKNTIQTIKYGLDWGVIPY